MGPVIHADRNWTVSLGERRLGDPLIWAVYCEGRIVVGGWPKSDDARWALGMLRQGQRPPYIPKGYEITWPEGMEP